MPVGFGLIGLLAMLFIVYTARPGYLESPDLTPYLIQAEIFASGRLCAPAPPPAEDTADFFATFGMVREGGREYSRQPPGASAVLAALLLVGDIRYVPPILSAVALGLTLVWIRRMFDTRTAVLALCLCLADTKYLYEASAILSYPPPAAS